MTPLLMRAFFALHRGEDGQALVEYALIVALVSVGAALVLGRLSAFPQSIFSHINADLP